MWKDSIDENLGYTFLAINLLKSFLRGERGIFSGTFASLRKYFSVGRE